jgi:hypothetical protein
VVTSAQLLAGHAVELDIQGTSGHTKAIPIARSTPTGRPA